MSIEGSLQDYEILDVITILANRAESGRLYIDFESAEGFLYFDKGKLVAAQVGGVAGISAVNLAISMEGKFFRFEPGAQTTISHFTDPNEKRMLKQLLGIESMSPPTTTAGQRTSYRLNESDAPAKEVSQVLSSQEKDEKNPPDNFASTPQLKNRASFSNSHRQALTVGTASVLSVGLLAAAGLAAHWGTRQKSPPLRLSSEANNTATSFKEVSATASSRGDNKEVHLLTHSNSPTPSNAAALPTDTRSKAGSQTAEATGSVRDERGKARMSSHLQGADADESTQEIRPFKEINVVVKIEGGRVTEAYIKKRHPDETAYEATALQLARQRRFSNSKDGIETIVFRVAKEQ